MSEVPASTNFPFKTNGLIPHTSIEVTETFSGPLPHPDILRKYDMACPGAADRLLSYVELEANHRRQLELSALTAEIRAAKRDSLEAKRGQVFALVITLSALGLGAAAAMTGHEVAGTMLGVGGIGGIVATFLGQRNRAEAPQEKPAAATR